jgi:AraC family transcriptional regulator
MPKSKIKLVDRQTGSSFAAAPDTGVIFSSADVGWRGITIELHHIPPLEMPEHYIEGHRLLVNVGQPVHFEWKEGSHWQSTDLQPGEFSLQTHGDINFPRWTQNFEFLEIALDPSFVVQLFQDTSVSETLMFQTRRGEFDLSIANFARCFKAELESGSYCGVLYGESLALAFALHLIECHRDRSQKLRRLTGRLTSLQLKEVIEYIHEHLSEELSLVDLADRLNLSPFHFARLFKNSLAISPHQYVMQNRIERAKKLIAVSAKPNITEIGLQVGFFDGAHFTKVFKRVVGIAPKTFVKHSV